MDRSKWEYKRLSEICDKSSSNIAQNKIEDISGEFGLYGASGYVKGIDFYHQEKPYIGVVKDGSGVGRVNVYPAKTSLLGTMQYILPKEDCNLGFLLYLLRGLHLEKFKTGAAIPHIYFKDYGKSIVPYPPLADQLQIVAELDCLNEMIALKQEQLKEFDKLAQSIFYDMFGDPMINDKNWEVSSYGKEFEIGSGGTPSKSVASYWKNGNIPWIGSNMCQNCFIYDNDGKYITQSGLNNSSAKILTNGTILFALVGATIGKVGILKKEMATNQNIAFVNVSKSDVFDPIFVFFHSMKLYPLFMNLGNGGFKMANQSFIKDLPIILPPLSLQQVFAEKIQAIEAQKELVKQSIAETQKLLDYTMDYYFND